MIAAAQYKIAVAAVNELGTGPYSVYTATAGGYGFTLDKPNPVSSFTRHSDNPLVGEIKLSWSAITGASNTGGDADAYVKYDLFAAIADDFW